MNETRHRKLFFQTGRAGDIFNSLPLARQEWSDSGIKPYYMVARAYADLLDGVSYVEPVIWEGEFWNCIGALFQARKLTPNIIMCQIYGRAISHPKDATSFTRQSWVMANAEVPWGSLPLVFDQRDRNAEMALIHELLPDGAGGKKIILTALNGASSPFPFRRLVERELKSIAQKMPFLVLDLSEFRCRRFYDLLGLYDIAHCLVTVDTGHLHLAHASHVPVVSFITRDPDPWHGSAWRGNHVGRYYYDELPGCLSSAMVRTLAADKPDTRTKIIHAFADDRVPEPGSDLARRISVAQASWETEYAISGRWISGEWQQEKADRSGKEIGDPATVPYVHDVVKCGLAASTQEADIIALTNSDVGFTPGLSGWVLEACERHGCAWTHRRDFPRIEKPFVSETAVRYGKFYPGTDAFFFTVKWWREHGKEYGDFLMGREFWDEVLRQLMKYHGGAGIENAIWHEWHESFWCGALREKLPGNLHNKWLREVWFAETGFIPEDFRYFRTNAEATMHAHPRK